MPDTTPRTADRTEFKLGMTLVTRDGHARPTDPESHELTFEPGEGGHPGEWVIGRRGSGCSTAVRTFYSSEPARRACIVAELEAEKAAIQRRIDALKGQRKGG